MSNRRIIARVGPHTSKRLRLFHLIPYPYSLICVILLHIAFNKLSKIKEIKCIAYADDFFLIIHFNKNINTNFSIDNEAHLALNFIAIL